MKNIRLLNKLKQVLEVTFDDHSISYQEITNTYTNLRKKEPELFDNQNEEANK